MPPRRTRAMGFSPGGAKALDISAPSRKRKNSAQEEVSELTEAGEDRPAKRTRAKTITPEPSTDDSKRSRAPLKNTKNNQTGRTARRGTRAVKHTTDSSLDVPDMTSAPSIESHPVRRTRGQANTESTDNNQQNKEELLSTSTEVRSKKRTRTQPSQEHPSESGAEPQQSSIDPEGEVRASKRSRVNSQTQSTSISKNPKAGRQSKTLLKIEPTPLARDKAPQQPSPPLSEPDIVAQTSSGGVQEGLNVQSAVNRGEHAASAVESDAPSDGSDGEADFGDRVKGLDDNQSENNVEDLLEHINRSSRSLLEPHRRSATSSHSYTSAPEQSIKTSASAVDSVHLTDNDMAEIDYYRNKSSAWKFAQSTYQRKFAVDEEMEDEDWERLAAQQSSPKYPLKSTIEDIDKARRSATPTDRYRNQDSRFRKHIDTRYIEWVDDSDAMFVVRDKDQLPKAARGLGSNREKNISSLPAILLVYKAVPLTNRRIIDAVSTTIELCTENPESIPTAADFSSFFKGVAKSKQSRPVAFATPERGGNQNNIATRNPVTPSSQHSYRSPMATEDSTATQQPPPGNANGLAEHHEQAQEAAQPDTTRGGWAAALSASRIGTLIRTPLRFFSNTNRAQQNAPATEVRRVGSQASQSKITRSARSHRNPKIDTTIDIKANSRHREHGASRSSSNAAPKTPTPAQRHTGRRRDAHLPVEWRGVRYQDLPPEMQAISEHMKPDQKSESKTLSEEEQKFLDDNLEAKLKQREINLRRILSGRRGIEMFRDEDDVTQVAQDLSHDQPGNKRKRVTFDLNAETSKESCPGTFSVPDDSDEDSSIASMSPVSDSPASSRHQNKKRSPRLPMPDNISPSESHGSPRPTKKARVERKETAAMGPQVWLNMTIKDVIPSYGEPIIPPAGWKREQVSSPLHQGTGQRDENVFEAPEALSEISGNRTTTKPVIHDCFQNSEKNKPKKPSTLRQVTTVSPASSPGTPLGVRGLGVNEGSKRTVKSDYGPFVTDPVVIAAVDALREDEIVAEKFPLQVYKEMMGVEWPGVSSI